MSIQDAPTPQDAPICTHANVDVIAHVDLYAWQVICQDCGCYWWEHYR